MVCWIRGDVGMESVEEKEIQTRAIVAVGAVENLMRVTAHGK